MHNDFVENAERFPPSENDCGALYLLASRAYCLRMSLPEVGKNSWIQGAVEEQRYEIERPLSR